MVPEDRGKRPIASWFIDKPVKNEVAAGEGHFNGIPLRMRRSGL